MALKGKQRMRLQRFDEITLIEDKADKDYMEYLMSVRANAKKKKKAKSSRKRIKEDEELEDLFYNDDDDEEEEEEEKEKDDPDFMKILAGMKEDGKSYRFEHVVNGCRVIIKYEEPLNSDTQSDEEPRRKLRSAQIPHLKNQGMLDSHHTPSTKLKRLTWRQTRSKSKNKKEENSSEDSDAEHRRMRSGMKRDKETQKLTRGGPRKKSKIEKEEDIILMDPDYYIFSKNFKIVNSYPVFDDGNHKVVYEGIGKWIRVKEEREDVAYSDVEILDSTAFYKMDKGCSSNQWDTTVQSEFRRDVMAALRKPFDREELQRLSRQIKHSTAKERHLDLRNGREKAMGTQEDGKSFLDYYPVFRRKLAQAKGDQQMSLNLLRGFFLWIKKPEPPFDPWNDAECLAVYPELGSDYDDY